MEILSGLAGLFVAASDLLIMFAAYSVVEGIIERQAARAGFNPQATARFLFWVACGALIGARLAYIAPHWSIYTRYPLDLLRLQTGLSFFGGMIGALAIVVALRERAPLPIAQFSDMLALSVPVGIAIQRAGCLIRGECYGATIPFLSDTASIDAPAPRYPAELIEVILVAALILILRRWRARARSPGELGLAALTLYGLVRAAVDGLRINLSGWPNPDQVGSLALAMTAGIAWAWIKVHRLERVAPATGEPDRTVGT